MPIGNAAPILAPGAVTEPSVYVIHENAEWLAPLRQALDTQQTPWQEWFIDNNHLDLREPPPDGVFYNRMSASSHTRDHRYAVEMTEAVLAWLKAHGRIVINGPRALHLEVRKAEQMLSLNAHGIRTPETLVASGTESVLAAARALGESRFIIKPNRGGKGLGVQLFDSLDALDRWLDRTDAAALSPDGITLVQRYIRPASGHITRLEFIGGEFFYAVAVDSSGGFELCPADACSLEDAAFCPADGSTAMASANRFRINRDFSDPELIERLTACFQSNDITVGAAEFVEDSQGQCYVYDINTNTNYNQQAEREASVAQSAYQRLAQVLGEALEAPR